MVRKLLRHLFVYGLGDAASSLVSFLLLPVYTRYLSPSDYGIITMLLTVEAVTRILFRWGTDGAFMRLFYDCKTPEAQQRLASTLTLFLVAANGVLLALGFAVAPWLGRFMFGVSGHDGLVRLVIFTTFLSTFHFMPNSLLRIREQSKLFAALTFAKSFGTIIIRLILVVPMRTGVAGVVVADAIIAVAFTIIMAKWMLPLLRPVFSREVLRDALRYGLPRLPHAVAHQAIAVSDRYLMAAFLPLRDIGLYGVGSSFGQALKLALNGFEFAWAPFYFGAMHRPDARALYSRLGTYLFAVVVLLAAGMSAVAADLVRLMTEPEFATASIVIPWVALGVVAQASYQVAAIGLNITKQTKYFPISTGIAAVFSVAANVVLIPRYGLLGAAWANAASYSVLTLTIGWFASRVYPVQYEWKRLGLIGAAGLVAYASAVVLAPTGMHPLGGLLLRGSIVTVMYPAMLWITSFLERSEIEQLVGVWRSLGKPARPQVPAGDTTEMGGELAGDGAGLAEFDPASSEDLSQGGEAPRPLGP